MMKKSLRKEKTTETAPMGRMTLKHIVELRNLIPLFIYLGVCGRYSNTRSSPLGSSAHSHCCPALPSLCSLIHDCPAPSYSSTSFDAP